MPPGSPQRLPEIFRDPGRLEFCSLSRRTSLPRARFQWFSPSTAFGPKKFVAPGPASGARCCHKVTVIGEGCGWATCYEPESLKMRLGAEVCGNGAPKCFSPEASPAGTRRSAEILRDWASLGSEHSYLASGQISLISPFSEMRPLSVSQPVLSLLLYQNPHSLPSHTRCHTAQPAGSSCAICFL